MTIIYVMDVPSDWDKAMVEFHLNESSSCASNVIDKLKELDSHGCLCFKADDGAHQGAKFEVLKNT